MGLTSFPYTGFVKRLSLLAVPLQSECSLGKLLATKLVERGTSGVPFRSAENSLFYIFA